MWEHTPGWRAASSNQPRRAPPRPCRSWLWRRPRAARSCGPLSGAPRRSRRGAPGASLRVSPRTAARGVWRAAAAAAIVVPCYAFLIQANKHTRKHVHETIGTRPASSAPTAAASTAAAPSLAPGATAVAASSVVGAGTRAGIEGPAPCAPKTGRLGPFRPLQQSPPWRSPLPYAHGCARMCACRRRRGRLPWRPWRRRRRGLPWLRGARLRRRGRRRRRQLRAPRRGRRGRRLRWWAARVPRSLGLPQRRDVWARVSRRAARAATGLRMGRAGGPARAAGRARFLLSCGAELRRRLTPLPTCAQRPHASPTGLPATVVVAGAGPGPGPGAGAGGGAIPPPAVAAGTAGAAVAAMRAPAADLTTTPGGRAAAAAILLLPARGTCNCLLRAGLEQHRRAYARHARAPPARRPPLTNRPPRNRRRALQELPWNGWASACRLQRRVLRNPRGLDPGPLLSPHGARQCRHGVLQKRGAASEAGPRRGGPRGCGLSARAWGRPDRGPPLLLVAVCEDRAGRRQP
jgi:hypothetical protein